MRSHFKVLAVAACLFLPSFAQAGDAKTTRIETRQFYGATVTLEEGVRVFRALPPHDRVIINPGGRAPVSLSYEENHHYGYAPRGVENGQVPVVAGAPVYGVPHTGLARRPHTPRAAVKPSAPAGHRH